MARVCYRVNGKGMLPCRPSHNAAINQEVAISDKQRLSNAETLKCLDYFKKSGIDLELTLFGKSGLGAS